MPLTSAGVARCLVTMALMGCLGLAAGPATATAREAAPVATPVLKFVTFNILHGGVASGLMGNAQDLDRRLEMAAEELRGLEADIIGLQEASSSRDRGSVAERLASRLGFHYVYAPASSRLFSSAAINKIVGWLLNFSEGPAIVSRFPIVKWEALELPRCGRFFEPRILLYAELETPRGRLPVFSTHTAGDPCQTKRVAQFVEARRGPLPAVLMGDFNAAEGSPAIAVLTAEARFFDAFRAANPEAPGLTVWQPVDVPTPMVRRRVDYVFVVPGQTFPGRILGSRVVLNTPQRLGDGRVLWPSDHYGVLAELEVFPSTPSR